MWTSEAHAESGQPHGAQDYWRYGTWEDATSVTNTGSTAADLGGGKTYYNRCGWEGYSWEQLDRVHFRFSDSHITGSYKHAASDDGYVPLMRNLHSSPEKV